MRAIYAKPSKVYFAIALFTLLGIGLAQYLPVNLFPKSSKPEFVVSAGLVNITDREFLNNYGWRFKSVLRKLDGVESVSMEGWPSGVEFNVKYKWGVNSKAAEKDIQASVESFRSLLPFDMQKTLNFWKAEKNSAEFVASIQSPDGQISQLKKFLEPILLTPIQALEGVKEAYLIDPNWQNIYITIDPEAMASHRVNSAPLARYIESVLTPLSPGRVTLGQNNYQILIQNQIQDFSNLEELSLEPLGHPGVKLKDIAKVELKTSPGGTRIFKTDGQVSLILNVSPTDDANLKQLSDNIANIITTSYPQWPKGSSYKIFINPSDFINSAIKDVYESIFLGGFFAVLILLLFVGSLRLTVFSALEIPLAMAWSFILMYFFDVSINLVSLGGLALAAGMNVDASVVMVENIIRHFEMKKNKVRAKLDVILDAVNEVKWPIVTSTLTSVIVFLPLSATSGITYAVLGDLAKAVVFSHVFSAVVAVILVPTVRSQFMNDEEKVNFVSQIFNRQYDRFVEFYKRTLQIILRKRSLRLSFIFTSFATVALTTYLLFPHIKKEIIALPSSDLLYISVWVEGVDTTEDVATIIEPYEKILKNDLKDYVAYTYTDIKSKSYAAILPRLRTKKNMQKAIDAIDKALVSTPNIKFRIYPYNPSKMPLPDPADITVKISGNEQQRFEYAERLRMELRGTRLFNGVHSSVRRDTQFTMQPFFHSLENLRQYKGPTYSELAEMLSTGIKQKGIGYLRAGDETKYVYLRYPDKWFETSEDLAAMPVVAGSYVLPLKALTDITVEDVVSGTYIEEDNEISFVDGYFNQEAKKSKSANEAAVRATIDRIPKGDKIQVRIEDSLVEINKSLKGLMWAFLISLALIAVIVYWQFESIRDVITVKAAIPLGFIGVSLALYIFKSTWSINSILGVILLGGIAVNNSILLVSFFNQCLEEGLTPVEAAVKSASIRMRPILITSLTTILAMIPIALGWGQGGEVLQPLGISVSFGMLFSTVLTLLIIPCLEVTFARQKA